MIVEANSSSYQGIDFPSSSDVQAIVIPGQEMTVSPYRLAFSPLQAIRSAEFFDRREMIPLSAIAALDDTIIVDGQHVNDLRSDMERVDEVTKRKIGQLIEICVCAREVDGRVVYDVVDGYHRTEAMKQIPDITFARAQVLYGRTPEQVFDERILAAHSVGSVQFARLIDWMRRSYELSEWASSGITLTQAFGIADNPKSTRTNLAQLSTDDVVRLKDWARAKAKKWGRDVGSMHQTFRAVEEADPALILEVRRSKGGGKDHQVFITSERLIAVVAVFPGKENYGLQRAILEFGVSQRHSADQTEYLANAAQGLISSHMSREDINSVLGKIQIPEEIGLAVRAMRSSRIADAATAPLRRLVTELQTQLTEAQGDLNTRVQGAIAPYVQQVEELQAQLIVSGRRAQLETRQGLASPATLNANNNGNGRKGGEMLDELEAIIAILSPSVNTSVGNEHSNTAFQQQVARADALLQANKYLMRKLEAKRSENQHTWWETVDYLSSEEIKVLKALIRPDTTFDEAVRKLGLTPTAATQILVDSFRKRLQHEREIRDLD